MAEDSTDRAASRTAFRTRYFSATLNVGDRIAPLVAQGAANLPAVFNNDGAKPHLLCIGSVLGYANPRSLIWGTGCFGPRYPIGKVVSENVFAVRGKKTAALLRERGALKRDVALGDPGSLVAHLNPWKDLRFTAKRYQVGLVPHLSDLAHPFVTKAKMRDDVLVLDVRDEPDRFLAQLAQCSAVMSSSLHGIVFADAFSIPTLWIRLAGRLAGGTFKFEDYFSGCANPQVEPVEVRDISSCLSACELRDASGVVKDLIAAFPSEALAQHGATLELADGFRTIEQCRREDPPIVDLAVSAGVSNLLTAANLVDVVSRIIRDTHPTFSGWAEPQPFCAIDPRSRAKASSAIIKASARLLKTTEKIDAILVPVDAQRPGGGQIQLTLSPPFERQPEMAASEWMIVCKPFASRLDIHRIARADVQGARV